jgi:hypothetical protein
MLAMALAFGLVFVACDNGSTGGGSVGGDTIYFNIDNVPQWDNTAMYVRFSFKDTSNNVYTESNVKNTLFTASNFSIEDGDGNAIATATLSITDVSLLYQGTLSECVSVTLSRSDTEVTDGLNHTAYIKVVLSSYTIKGEKPSNPYEFQDDPRYQFTY